MKTFTLSEAKDIGTAIGVDWDKVDAEEFRAGLAVELEHGSRDPQTNVIDDDYHLAGKIAWAHLKEIGDYYTRLKRMESDAGK